MTYNRYNIVKVPFPFTDRQSTKTRPALVLSDGKMFNSPIGHSVMAMITTAKRSDWPLDTSIEDLTACGLPAILIMTQTYPIPGLGGRTIRLSGL